MYEMFAGCSFFNQSLNWNVSNMTNIIFFLRKNVQKQINRAGGQDRITRRDDGVTTRHTMPHTIRDDDNDKLVPARVVTPSLTKIFYCTANGCGKQFPHQWSLKRHMRNHMGVMPHKCRFDGCTMTFVQKCSRDRHEATHSNRKPYVCPFCDAAFKLPEYLKSHQLKLHKHILNDVHSLQLHHILHSDAIDNVASFIHFQRLQIKHYNTLITRILTFCHIFDFHIPKHFFTSISQYDEDFRLPDTRNNNT